MNPSSIQSIQGSSLTPLVSINILNWNGKTLLAECLDSVLKTTYKPIEIIVADNGSTDGSVAFIAENYPSVKIVDNVSNLGYAAGNNRGFAFASGSYFVTLNNDVIVTPDWLNEPVALLNALPDTGIISCTQLNYYANDRIDSLFISPNIQLMHTKIGYGLLFSACENYSRPGYVFAANGAAAMYRATLIKELGGFDERFFAYHEESDLCMRAFLSGWNCVYSPKSIVYHKVSQSFGKFPDKLIYYGERNRYWYIFKNFPLSYIFLNAINLLKGEWWCLKLVVEKKYPFGVFLRSRVDCFFGIFRFIPDHIRAGKKFYRYRKRYERFIAEQIIPLETNSSEINDLL